MSLINQMLQDLDRRHATMAGSIPLETVRANNSAELVTAAKKASPKFTIGLMTLALCAGAGWYVVTQMHLPLLKVMQQHPHALQAEVISSANANLPEGAKPAVGAAQRTALAADLVNNQAITQASNIDEQLALLTKAEMTNAALLHAKIDEINQLKTQLQQMAEEASKHALTARQLPSAKRIAQSTDTSIKPVVENLVADNAAKAKLTNTDSVLNTEITSSGKSQKVAADTKADGDKLATNKSQFNKQTSPEQEADSTYNQALSMLQLGRAPEAQELLTKALAFNPNNLEVRQTLVGVLVDLKRNAEAMDCLKVGLESAPQHIGFSQILARLLVENNQRADAMAVLTKALPYAREDAQFHAFLAALLQREDQHKEAIAHYLIALKHGNQANWLVGLGISLQAEGRAQEAREVYTRAQSTPLSNDLAQFVDQRLKQVQQQIN